MSKQKLTTKKVGKSDKEVADELLAAFREYQEEKRTLDANMKEAKTRILELAKRNRQEFNQAGHWDLNGGYVKTSEKTVVITDSELFSFKKFVAKFPDFSKLSFDVTMLKKAFSDGYRRKQLEGMGVDLEIEESLDIVVK